MNTKIGRALAVSITMSAVLGSTALVTPAHAANTLVLTGTVETKVLDPAGNPTDTPTPPADLVTVEWDWYPGTGHHTHVPNTQSYVPPAKVSDDCTETYDLDLDMQRMNLAYGQDASTRGVSISPSTYEDTEVITALGDRWETAPLYVTVTASTVCGGDHPSVSSSQGPEVLYPRPAPWETAAAPEVAPIVTPYVQKPSFAEGWNPNVDVRVSNRKRVGVNVLGNDTGVVNRHARVLVTGARSRTAVEARTSGHRVVVERRNPARRAVVDVLVCEAAPHWDCKPSLVIVEPRQEAFT